MFFLSFILFSFGKLEKYPTLEGYKKIFNEIFSPQVIINNKNIRKT